MFAKFITKPTCNELGSKKEAKPKNYIFKLKVKLRALTKTIWGGVLTQCPIGGKAITLPIEQKLARRKTNLLMHRCTEPILVCAWISSFCSGHWSSEKL